MRIYNLVSILNACIFLCSCASTTFLKDDQLLVNNPPSFVGNKYLSNELLLSGVQTAPNRSLFLGKTYLHFYNLGLSIEQDTSLFFKLINKIDRNKYYQNGASQFLKIDIGEPPSLVNENQLIADAKNLENIYYANGFLDARVRYSIRLQKTSPQKANITFHIEENTPYIIDSIIYCSALDAADSTSFTDSSNTITSEIIELLEANRKQSLLKKGERYNESNFSAERTRITELLRNNGYYQFNSSMVRFEIDLLEYQTTETKERLKKQISLLQLMPNLKILRPLSNKIKIKVFVNDTLDAYRFDSINVKIRFFFEDDLSLRINPSLLSSAERDSLNLPFKRARSVHDVWFSTNYSNLSVINLNTIAKSIYFKRKSKFNIDSLRLTQKRFQEIGIFRSSVIKNKLNHYNQTINAEIDLILQKRFSYKIGLEAFQTEQVNLVSNLPGLGLNLQLNARNAFKRAEQVNFSINNNLSRYAPNDSTALLFYQVGAKISLITPRFFLMELPLDRLIQRKKWLIAAPQTSLSLTYNRENPVEYLRNTITANFSYEWLVSRKKPRWAKYREHHIFTPLVMTVVNSHLTIEFIDQILGPGEDIDRTISYEEATKLLSDRKLELLRFVNRDFEFRFNSATRYYRTLSFNYAQDKTKTSWFVKYGVEIGGNIPYLMDWVGKFTGLNDGSIQDGKLYLSKVDAYTYGQFTKASIEIRRFIPFSTKSELVQRLTLGYALPYNRSKQIPLEYRFYAGGTSSIRGWQANTLGPGTYRYIGNQIFTFGGEFKFETNIEYRHDFINPVELAYFIDAGNVWFVSKDALPDHRSRLSWKTFQLGVAAGTGFRFDLSFIILRFDIGQQIYAPEIQDFVIKRFPKDIGFPRIQYNIGIGYPF